MSKYSILQYPKKTQKLSRIGAPGGRFEIFHPFHLSQIIKKMKGGGPFVKNVFDKKSCKAERKLKGGKLKGKSCFPVKKSLAVTKRTKRGLPFCLSRYCMLRGKKENLFGSVPWANRYNLAP